MWKPCKATKYVYVILLLLLPTAGCTKYVEKQKAKQSFVEGARLFNKSEYKEALAKFTYAADKFREIDDPRGESDALVYAATAYSMMKQGEQALQTYEQAIKANQRLPANERDVRHAEILLAIACVHLNSSDLAQATTNAQQALQLADGLEPKVAASISPNAHSVLGMTYMKEGKYATAIEHLQTASSGMKGQFFAEATVLTTLGLVYNNMGDYEKSVSFHDMAIQKTHGAKALIAQCYASISLYPGTYEGGVQGLNAMLFLNRGVSKRNMGDYTGAIQDFERAMELLKEQPNHPTRGTAEFNLGLTYLEKGDSQKALVVCHTSIDG
jgi:tetratricopeptide (TPR) repeat protein